MSRHVTFEVRENGEMINIITHRPSDEIQDNVESTEEDVARGLCMLVRDHFGARSSVNGHNMINFYGVDEEEI